MQAGRTDFDEDGDVSTVVEERSDVASSPPFTTRHHRLLLRFGLPLVAVAAVLAGVFAALHGAQKGSLAGLGAAVAILIAAAIAYLGLSLPGISREGVFVGACTAGAAIMSWTHTTQPAYVWSILAVEGVGLAVWTFPWWRDLPLLVRLGSAWVGIAVWALGTVSAVLVLHTTVAAQRAVYGTLAALVALLWVQAARRRGVDPSLGFVAALLVALALVVAAGAANVFTLTHYTPPGPWGARFNSRFWGGPLLVYHPNLMALSAMVVAMRLGPDAMLRRWKRIGGVGVAVFFLYETNSRTSVLVALMASLVWLIARVITETRARRHDRRSWVSAATARAVVIAVLPALLTISVVGVAGGRSFLLQNRYGAPQSTSADAVDGDLSAQGGFKGLSSGRSDVWKLIFKQWSSDSLVEKLAGNDDNSRGYILRYGPKVPITIQPKLTADNAPIGALHRSGVLGVLAFAFGGLLLLWNVWRRRPPLWYVITVFGAAATIMTEDELLGGAGSTVWAALLAGEVALLAARGRQGSEPDAALP